MTNPILQAIRTLLKANFGRTRKEPVTVGKIAKASLTTYAKVRKVLAANRDLLEIDANGSVIAEHTLNRSVVAAWRSEPFYRHTASLQQVDLSREAAVIARDQFEVVNTYTIPRVTEEDLRRLRDLGIRDFGYYVGQGGDDRLWVENP
jgi:hypothetical protein